MFNWLRELYELRAEFRACKTCDALRLELSATKIREQRLLEKLLFTEEPIVVRNQEPQKIQGTVPWPVLQRQLEKKDAEAAAKMAEERQSRKITAEFERKRKEAQAASGNPEPEIKYGSDIESLEREMGIVEEGK